MSLLQRFKAITTFVLDVDGVLTDGSIWVMESGEQIRQMNIKDGYALQLAIKKGYRILVISGANSPAVKLRLEKLGIQDVYMQASNKSAILLDFCDKHQITTAEILYMGDDIPDFEVMALAGVACAPADATAEIKHHAHYISPVAGGKGCVREVIEKVMKLRGDWSIDTSVPSK